MPTTVKMRCTRVTEFDSGGTNMREVQLVSTDRDGAALNLPEEVVYASFSANLVDPFGAEIQHDALVDVVITVSAPAGLSVKETKEAKGKK